MAQGFGDIKIEGLKEFQRAARKGTDSELPKRLGRAHKHIGELVISKLSPAPTPAAVGVGGGSSVRPSASKRDVLLRVGGGHRAGHSPEMQWGRKPGRRPGTPAPKRPYIKGTVDAHRGQIETEYLQAISAAMSGAFAETKP